MDARVVALYRYPVKGFTPERLDAVVLEPGRYFPYDRLFAVERGPSGFDSAKPAHISKWRFTVLANHPKLARATTAWNESLGRLDVRVAHERFAFDLEEEAGAEAFALWLETYLGTDEPMGPLRLVAAGSSHRFTDDAEGYVSVTNLASVRDLALRMGRTVDPLRLRANIHLDGLRAGLELTWPPGTRLQLGECEVQVVKPIPRCIATHVDPASGERDLDLVQALREHYGHVLCGVYVRVIAGGLVADGCGHAFAVRS